MSIETLAKPVAPEDQAQSLAQTMLRIIEELNGLMLDEMDLVERRKHAEHADMLRRKQQLTVNYRAGMKRLAGQPDLFKQLPDNLRNKLKIAAQKLAEITDRNARCLRGAVIATQRLVRTFVELVREEVAVKSGYSNARAGAMQLGNYDRVCKPVAVNRTA